MEWIKWAFIILGMYIVSEVIIRVFIPRLKGASGEATVSVLLKRLPENEYKVLHNVILRTDRGMSQVDHVVVSVYGIFVIEVKNYTGWITGSEYGSQWTQTIYRKKSHFMNPIHQNYGHVKAIEALIDDPTVPIYSIVTFPGDATMKVNVQKSSVVKWGNLTYEIKSLSHDVVMDQEKMNRIAALITNSNIDSRETRKEHVESIRETKKKAAEGICPRCGGQLVVRNGKYGKFLGCSNYPKCRYTQNL